MNKPCKKKKLHKSSANLLVETMEIEKSRNYSEFLKFHALENEMCSSVGALEEYISPSLA